jgi:hypothetical protein
VLDVAFGTLITGWDGWAAVEDAVKAQDPLLDEACQRALVQLAIRPLNGGVIGCAMAHRANKIAYAMVRDQSGYDPDRWA